MIYTKKEIQALIKPRTFIHGISGEDIKGFIFEDEAIKIIWVPQTMNYPNLVDIKITGGRIEVPEFTKCLNKINKILREYN